MADKALIESDDRGLAPSASKLSAIAKCPAFHQANQLFTWYGDRDAADEGTARHKNEEDQIPIEDILDDERRRCAINCRKALNWCREDLGITECETTIEREARLWCDDKWSGQLDYLETWTKLIDGKLTEFAFVADYKTLRGEHDPADQNIQLLAQAVLCWLNYPKVSEVFVALIEPFQDPIYSTASYTSTHLRGRSEWFLSVVEEATGVNPKRVAGSSQCKWCAAIPFCPEARKKMEEIIKWNG